jgi:peptidoglycan-associated lipoprotein
MKLQVVRGVGLITAVVMLAACHKQVAVAHPPVAPAEAIPAKTSTPAQTSQPSAAVRVAENTSPRMPDAATKVRIQDLLNRIQDVYFDYDKHTLRPDAQSTLQADATTLRQILEQYPTYKLTIQGYCDERGSDAYNLALGDSRAKKAEEFLESLGLPASQLRTVSYGKEKPVCEDHTESCWQKNRRAHITQDQQAG